MRFDIRHGHVILEGRQDPDGRCFREIDQRRSQRVIHCKHQWGCYHLWRVFQKGSNGGGSSMMPYRLYMCNDGGYSIDYKETRWYGE